MHIFRIKLQFLAILKQLKKLPFGDKWRYYFLVLTLLIIDACQFKDLSSVDSSKVNLIQYVNPIIGTDSNPEKFQGNTAPVTAMPFGMNLWVPNTTSSNENWIYSYESKKIKGIRCSHQPNPLLGDYGAFSIMPLTGELTIDDNRRASEFNHTNELATPYSYEVFLDRYNVKAEVVPTLRGGSLNFTFPESSSSYLLLDALEGESYIRIIPQQKRIVGFCKNNSGGVPKNFAAYFILEFDKPFLNYTLWNQDSLNSSRKEIKGMNVGAAVKFSTSRNEQINVKVATSFISIPQAITNFNNELLDYSFDDLKIQANQAWNNELNKIVVEGGTNDQKTIFYTSLYRTLLFPKIFYEFDETGRIVHYSPFDGRIHDGFLYTDIGYWNANRTLFPFLTLLYPEMTSNILKGLLNAYKEGGWLPQHPSPGYRKSQIGNHAAAIFTDAYTKGIVDFDVDLAYASMKKDAIVTPPKYAPGRDGLKEYNDNGYVPTSEFEYSVTKTLEYSYDDYCIWRLGKELNKIDDLELYLSKSFNYRNLFDKKTGFIRGKSSNGTFDDAFDPKEWGGPYAKGNAWHYNWNTPYDVAGLIDLFGGDAEFLQKFDSLFLTPPEFKVGTYQKVIPEMTEMVLTDLGQYFHGNPALQHAIYMYNYVGQPWKTQELVNTTIDKLYKTTPAGYSGDEHMANLSSWFLFSSMGFYPVAPGTNEYVLGAPLFQKITIFLENGKNFVIEAPERSAGNFFVEEIELNGNKYEKNYIPHFEIMKGGRLFFDMNNNANKKWGREEESYPFSLSQINGLVKQ